mmetsp:Transcript_46496/g.86743  ORF Transcript_46496/g.86743 Transcript_46496/m.86743 type:complete len:294 (-) Transcript_46496:85-966(-)
MICERASPGIEKRSRSVTQLGKLLDDFFVNVVRAVHRVYPNRAHANVLSEGLPQLFLREREQHLAPFGGAAGSDDVVDRVVQTARKVPLVDVGRHHHALHFPALDAPPHLPKAEHEPPAHLGFGRVPQPQPFLVLKQLPHHLKAQAVQDWVEPLLRHVAPHHTLSVGHFRHGLGGRVLHGDLLAVARQHQQRLSACTGTRGSRSDGVRGGVEWRFPRNKVSPSSSCCFTSFVCSRRRAYVRFVRFRGGGVERGLGSKHCPQGLPRHRGPVQPPRHHRRALHALEEHDHGGHHV